MRGITYLPTFVVLKVPFEVFQLNGTYISTFGMLHKFFFLIKTRSPSDPESRRHLQARFGCSSCPSLKYDIAAITALMPLPLTSASVGVYVVLSMILIGGLDLRVSEYLVG